MSKSVKASKPKRPQNSSRSQSHLIALEPRMMFDGAALATSVELSANGPQSETFAALEALASTIDPKIAAIAAADLRSLPSDDRLSGHLQEWRNFDFFRVSDGENSNQLGGFYAAETLDLAMAFGADASALASSSATRR